MDFIGQFWMTMTLLNKNNFSYAGDKIDSGCIDNQDGKDFKCTEESFDILPQP